MITELLNGGSCEVPQGVAVCPECEGRLAVESSAWDDETGVPTKGGLLIFCENEENINHAGLFPDWHPVSLKIEQWCGAVDN